MRARGVVQSPVLVGRDDFLALAGDRLAGAAVGAVVLAAAADQLAQSFGPARPTAPWHPLSEREFEVAQLVAAGLTNRRIAEQLTLAPKTISAHVMHILTKLGAARRAEIGAWCATVRQATPQPPRPSAGG